MPSMNARSTRRPPSGLSGLSRPKYSSLVSRSSSTLSPSSTLQVEAGVDAERGAVGEREAVAVAQADLQVRLGRERGMQAVEELEVVHGGDDSVTARELEGHRQRRAAQTRVRAAPHHARRRPRRARARGRSARATACSSSRVRDVHAALGLDAAARAAQQPLRRSTARTRSTCATSAVDLETKWVERSMKEMGLDEERLEYLLWDRVLHRELTSSGKPRLVTKTPNDVFIADRIKDRLAGREADLPAPPPRRDRQVPPGLPGDDADDDKNVDLIRRYCEALEAARQNYDGVTIRYEELTADPEATLRRVCDAPGRAVRAGDARVRRPGPRPLQVRAGRLAGQDQDRPGAGRRAAAAARTIPEPLRPIAATWGYLPQPAATPTPERSRRRRLLGPLAVALHRAVCALLAAPPGATQPQPGPVRFLLAHAWGMGGTIRTTSTSPPSWPAGTRWRSSASCAGARSRSSRCPTCRVRALARPARAAGALLDRVPSLLIHPEDYATRGAACAPTSRCCAGCARCAAACWSPRGPRSTCSPRGSRTASVT